MCIVLLFNTFIITKYIFVDKTWIRINYKLNYTFEIMHLPYTFKTSEMLGNINQIHQDSLQIAQPPENPN